MTDRLTWREVAGLKLGACIAFAEADEVGTKFGTIEIPVGTVCTIEEQGLAEIWAGIVVRPVDKALQRSLEFHQDSLNGCVIIISSNNDNPSPFVLDDSCPVECI